jgi:hypothetical protein
MEQRAEGLFGMPKKWTKRKERWEELTVGGELWGELRRMVQAGEASQIQEVKKQIEGWGKFLKAQQEAGEMPYAKYQWEKALKIVEIAEKAVLQPGGGGGIERICFNELDGWEWDVFCSLRGRPRSAIEKTRRAISILMEQPKHVGCLAILEVELVEDGRGEIYPDSEENAFLCILDDFKDAYERAWGMVKERFSNEEQRKLNEVDARFRLRHVEIPNYFNPPLVAVEGGSAGAGFYICLLHSAKAYLGHNDALLLDPSVGITATLEEEKGNLVLGGVGGLDGKMEAAYLRGLRMVIVADDVKEEARKELENARERWRGGYDAPTEVVACDTPDKAVEVASGLVEELVKFLHSLADELDLTPWMHEGERIKASEIAVEPFVLTKRERERKRARMEHEGREGIVEKVSPMEEIEAVRYEMPQMMEEWEELRWMQVLRGWVLRGRREGGRASSLSWGWRRKPASLRRNWKGKGWELMQWRYRYGLPQRLYLRLRGRILRRHCWVRWRRV